MPRKKQHQRDFEKALKQGNVMVIVESEPDDIETTEENLTFQVTKRAYRWMSEDGKIHTIRRKGVMV